MISCVAQPDIQAQGRYRLGDLYLHQNLDREYDFMTQHTDPIFTEALESVMIHQPEQVANYLSDYMKGNVDIDKYKRTVRTYTIHFGYINSQFIYVTSNFILSNTLIVKFVI